MIVNKNGSVFDSENARVILHQVNCMGVMGAGLAKQIRIRFPKVYAQYRKYCVKTEPENLLGTIQVVNCEEIDIVNCFGQMYYGRNKKFTDYTALNKCFYNVATRYTEETIAIPYGIGCGLAGGNWEIVYQLILNAFETYKGTVEIWKL